MARRSYDQYCSMATALDVVGERWTLLIVRELMLGPRRFKDLLDALPGIGRNLLSARMRYLTVEGLVRRRRLAAPEHAHVYELTQEGWSLGPVMTELGRWGVQRLGPREPRHFFQAGWAMFPLSYMADAEAARGLNETYEFRVGDEVFHLKVGDGRVVPRVGAAQDPDLVVTMPTETLVDMLAQSLSPVDAVAQGKVDVEGEPAVLGHALALWPPDAPQ